MSTEPSPMCHVDGELEFEVNCPWCSIQGVPFEVFQPRCSVQGVSAKVFRSRCSIQGVPAKVFCPRCSVEGVPFEAFRALGSVGAFRLEIQAFEHPSSSTEASHGRWERLRRRDAPTKATQSGRRQCTDLTVTLLLLNYSSFVASFLLFFHFALPFSPPPSSPPSFTHPPPPPSLPLPPSTSFPSAILQNHLPVRT